MKSRTPLVLGVAGGLVVVLTLGLLLVAWSKIPDDETGVKAFAAVLGLVGVLVTTGGTILGLAIKHSIDMRTIALNRETERRQNLEAAIGAVELLADDKGTAPALPERTGGALIALTSLGNYELALALLENLWRSGSVRVDSSSALSVIDAVLEIEESTIVSERLKIRATEALRQNPNGMIIQPSGLLRIPRPFVYVWPKYLPSEARQNTLTAILAATELATGDMTQEVNFWKSLEDFRTKFLNEVLLLLVRASSQSWERDYIRGSAASSILVLKDFWPADHEDYEIVTADGGLIVGDIVADARGVYEETRSVLATVRSLLEEIASHAHELQKAST